MEISDAKVEHVWVDDLPGMKIQFDVALSICFEILEGDFHYDDSEEKIIWIMARCSGDLECELNDFEIFETEMIRWYLPKSIEVRDSNFQEYVFDDNELMRFLGCGNPNEASIFNAERIILSS